MPILKNPRHEKFAQELAGGKSADEAYQLAGFSANRGNATRLKANESVANRVAEIHGRAAERVGITRESLLVEAEEIRQLALKGGALRTALAAVQEKGVLSGKRVERSETGQPGEFDDIEKMSGDELRRFIADTAERVKSLRLN